MSDHAPLHYYRVSTESVVRQRHERLIVARTPEEALTEYNLGTAWPSDYDTHRVELIEQKPTQVNETRDAFTDDLGDPNDPNNWEPRLYFTKELQNEIPSPPLCPDGEEFNGGDGFTEDE